jgi:hypothetical protein
MNFNQFWSSPMARKKKNDILYSRAKETDDDRTIYAILREELTAAELQKYTEIEKGIPVEKVIAEMEVIQREESQKNRRRKKA